MKVRKYQKETINKVVESLKINNAVLFQQPTGSGKTLITKNIVNSILKNNPTMKVIYIAPTNNIIFIMKETFGINETKDIIHLNDEDILSYNKNIFAGTKIALYKVLEKSNNYFGKNNLLIIDEADHSIKQSKIIVDILKPEKVIGMTATPERYDGLSLMIGKEAKDKYGVFQDFILGKSIYELIQEGYLSNFHLYSKPIKSLLKERIHYRSNELSFKQVNQEYKEYNVYGDVIENYEKWGKGKVSLGFTPDIQSAHKICKMFNKKGYKFYVISGKDSIQKQEEYIKKLQNKEIDCLVSAELFIRGTDIPEVEYAFSLKHIKSWTKYLQMIGRTLRRTKDKKEVYFVDHGNSIEEFITPIYKNPVLAPKIEFNPYGMSSYQKAQKSMLFKKMHSKMNFISTEIVEYINDSSLSNLIDYEHNDYEHNDYEKVYKYLETNYPKSKYSYENSISATALSNKINIKFYVVNMTKIIYYFSPEELINKWLKKEYSTQKVLEIASNRRKRESKLNPIYKEIYNYLNRDYPKLKYTFNSAPSKKLREYFNIDKGTIYKIKVIYYYGSEELINKWLNGNCSSAYVAKEAMKKKLKLQNKKLDPKSLLVYKYLETNYPKSKYSYKDSVATKIAEKYSMGKTTIRTIKTIYYYGSEELIKKWLNGEITQEDLYKKAKTIELKEAENEDIRFIVYKYLETNYPKSKYSYKDSVATKIAEKYSMGKTTIRTIKTIYYYGSEELIKKWLNGEITSDVYAVKEAKIIKLKEAENNRKEDKRFIVYKYLETNYPKSKYSYKDSVATKIAEKYSMGKTTIRTIKTIYYYGSEELIKKWLNGNCTDKFALKEAENEDKRFIVYKYLETNYPKSKYSYKDSVATKIAEKYSMGKTTIRTIKTIYYYGSEELIKKWLNGEITQEDLYKKAKTIELKEAENNRKEEKETKIF